MPSHQSTRASQVGCRLATGTFTWRYVDRSMMAYFTDGIYHHLALEFFLAMKHSKEVTADMHKRNSNKDRAFFVLLSCEERYKYSVLKLQAINPFSFLSVIKKKELMEFTPNVHS
ncbi:uncharacterized protein J3R85_013345 [Psidium guajava]|nr:uncharacterized protein J3R85_013345 [Psidium guajava]